MNKQEQQPAAQQEVELARKNLTIKINYEISLLDAADKDELKVLKTQHKSDIKVFEETFNTAYKQ